MANDIALRKRSQIAKANRTMFLWVAGASALLGFAVVVGILLGQQLLFNERVLAEKGKTVSTLEKNNDIIPDLQAQVRALDASEVLASSKAREQDQAIQVILDALPSEANSLALGSSLQNRLLAGIDGLTLNTLQVDPVIGVESLSDSAVESGAAETAGENAITFRFSVEGNQDALRQVLVNLERSIRTISLTSVQIESQGSVQVLTVQGSGFYEPAVQVELGSKVIQ